MAERKFTITATASKIAGSYSNIVLTITESASGFPTDFFSYVSDVNALDVRIYDATDTVEYSRYITHYSSTNSLITIKVLMPSIIASTAFTLTIHVGGSILANDVTIFSTAGILSYHNMSQEPNGAGASSITDFTAGANHLTPAGFDAIGSSLVDVSDIDKGIDFNGTDETMTGNTTAIANSTRGYFAKWIRVKTDRDTSERGFGLHNTGAASNYLVDLANSNDAYGLGNNSHAMGVVVGGNIKWLGQGPTNCLTIGTKQYVVWEHTGTVPTLFVNGVAQAITYYNQADKTLWIKGVVTDPATNKATVLEFAAWASLSVYSNVELDEMIIGNTTSTLGANFWLTQYNCESSQSTFWSCGTIELVTPVPYEFKATAQAVKLAANATDRVFVLTPNSTGWPADFFDKVRYGTALDIKVRDTTDIYTYKRYIYGYSYTTDWVEIYIVCPTITASADLPVWVHVGYISENSNKLPVTTYLPLGDVIDISRNNLTFGQVATTFSSGVIGNSAVFNGTTSFMATTTTLLPYALITANTINFCGKVTSDRNTVEVLLSLSNTAATTQLLVYYRELDTSDPPLQDTLYMYLIKDGTYQWQATLGQNWIDTRFNQWLHFSLSHNGTELSVAVNGVNQPITWVVSTNKTAWLKAICTDATSDVVNLVLGAQYLTVMQLPLAGGLDNLTITQNSDVFSTNDALSEYNNLFSQSSFWSATNWQTYTALTTQEYKFKATATATKVAATATNRVFVLTQQAKLWPDVFWEVISDPNALDVRVYDGATDTIEYSRVIYGYNNANSEIEIYIVVPNTTALSSFTVWVHVGGATKANDALPANYLRYNPLGNVNDISGNGKTLTNVNSTPFVAGQIGLAGDCNGTTQYFTHASLTDLAAITTGTWKGTFNLTSATPARNEMLLDLTRAAGNETRLLLYARWATTGGLPGLQNNAFVCLLDIDGVAQWSFGTLINTASSLIGTNAQFALVHNGTAPVLLINGVEVDITFSVTTNKTKWFKSVITDATNKADTLSIGARVSSSAANSFLDGLVDQHSIINEVWSTNDELMDYNCQSDQYSFWSCSDWQAVGGVSINYPVLQKYAQQFLVKYMNNN